MQRQGAVRLTPREMAANVIRGHVRWQRDGAKDIGWLSLQHGAIKAHCKTAYSTMWKRSTGRFPHRLYEKDAAFYVIGDAAAYHVAYPVYRVSIDAESEAA